MSGSRPTTEMEGTGLRTKAEKEEPDAAVWKTGSHCMVVLTHQLTGANSGCLVVFQALAMVMKRRSAWSPFTASLDKHWMSIDGSLSGCPYNLEAVAKFFPSPPRLESLLPAR